MRAKNVAALIQLCSFARLAETYGKAGCVEAPIASVSGTGATQCAQGYTVDCGTPALLETVIYFNAHAQFPSTLLAPFDWCLFRVFARAPRVFQLVRASKRSNSRTIRQPRARRMRLI